jgi:hypothetical protein
LNSFSFFLSLISLSQRFFVISIEKFPNLEEVVAASTFFIVMFSSAGTTSCGAFATGLEL